MRTRRLRKQNDNGIKKRIISAAIIFTLFLSFLNMRLFYIQIIQGKEYTESVKYQQYTKISLNKRRGNILDRNGVSFTSAGAQWRLKIITNAVGFNEKAYKVIQSLTGKTRIELTKNSNKAYDLPVINANSKLLQEISLNKYPGIFCYREVIRYDDNSLARHVIGFLHKSGNMPVSGIEEAFGHYLHPESYSYIDVFSDAAKRPLFNLDYHIKEPEGKCYDVQISLDYNIQKILERALDGYPGKRHGAIVIDALTGDILALASRPHYQQHNPSAKITDGMNSSFLAIPLEQYPIGSVYKIIVAAAALESGKFNEESTFVCSGGIQVGNTWVPCHAQEVYLNTITLREAFAHSCNDTFIRIAQQIGGEAIIKMSERFGLGKSIEIGLSNASGRLREKSEYTGAGIANLAIGQGSTMVTPLQAADIITTITNGGIRLPLRLVIGLIDSDKNLIEVNNKNIAPRHKYRVISRQTAETLAEWMGDVTEYGTASNIKCSVSGGIAGKTGTPQVLEGYKLVNYGWFTGFFPKYNPKYIIVVLSMEGGAAEMAVPVFHEIAKGIWLNYSK